MQLLKFILCVFITLYLTACGFRPQGPMQLAPPLKRLYVQATDPYGYLTRSLKQYLKMSNVQVVSSPAEASTILVILQDSTAEDLLSTSSTLQSRQYNLKAYATFQITDTKGKIISAPITLSETRTITVQSNQILGSNNEANLIYQQMRRALAYAIMHRIASREVTHAVNTAFARTDS